MLKLAILVQDIHRLNHTLERFERKYGVMSPTFYELYNTGVEPENDAWVLDFEEWAGLYEVWCDRQQAYTKALQPLFREQPSFASIIQSVAA
ncbi:MAG: hypothetical protein K8R89_00035 [Anaerolineae bacterium]|nr:hypothetical protein [Anaerolineae bacterium]